MELRQFEKIFRLYYPRLKRFAAAFLNDREEAEDLVQDVFLQLWQTRWTPEEDKNTGSYLFTLTRNRCLNALKHKIVEDKFVVQAARKETEELYHISFTGSSEYVSMEDTLLRDLESIIGEMPEKCGEAFRLKWFEGKKIREIAETMGISATMVDKHLAKGLEIARRKLNPTMFVMFLVVFQGKQ